MTETQFSGPATAEELFADIIKLARVTKESQNDAQLVRQEVRDLLAEFKKETKSILAKTEAIQNSYAPDAVKNAVRSANAVVDRLKGESEGTLVELKKQVDRVSNTILAGAMICASAIPVCLVVAGWISLQIAPNPIEISDRRADLRSLQEKIATASQQFEDLKGRLIVGEDGRRLVKYTTPIKLCVDPKREETCALYVPVP